MKMSLTTEDQENRSNNLDAEAYAAVNNFVNTGQQSYEEFVNNFLYLTAEDIVPSASQPVVQQMPEDYCSEIISAVSLDNNVRQSDDELDEEVLGAGQSCGIMSQTGASSSSTRLKFDNFIDEDNEDAVGDDEMHSGNGYVASFGESSEPNLSQEQQINALEGHRNAAISQCSRQTPTECVGSTSTQELLHSAAVTSTSDTTHASVVKNKENNEPKHEKTVNKISRDTNFIHQRASSDDIQLQMCYGDAPYPGEVEDEEYVKEVVPNIRQLDFTSRVRDPTEMDTDQDDTKSCSNEVVSFTIDEDFDYDNVVLTPKYSKEDLELMQRAREMHAAKTAT